MPQDQSPERRAYEPTETEPGAAQLFDPVAFARRIELARAQRAEALARRDGAEPAPAPAAGSADRPIRIDAAASPRRAAGLTLVAAEPLVAPQRRPVPPRSAGASRVAAAAFLALGVVIAISPPLRERAIDLAAPLLRTGAAAGLATPAATAPAQIPEPRLAGAADLATAVSIVSATPADPDMAVRVAGYAGPPEDAATPAVVGSELGSAPVRAKFAPAPIPPAHRPTEALIDGPVVATPVAPGVAAQAAPADTAAPIRRAIPARDVDVPRPLIASLAAPGPATPAADRPPSAPPGGASAAPAATVAGISLAIHAPSSISDAELAETIATLGSAGFPQASGVRVRMTIERTQVRYYHLADAAAARQVAAAIGADLRDFTHFSPPPAPGRVEVWLSGGSTAHRAPAKPREPTAVAPAPAPGPAPKLVIGRQTTLTPTRPALPALDRLYARPAATAAPNVPAPPAPPRPAPSGIDGGLY